MTKLVELIQGYDPERHGLEYLDAVFREAMLLDRKCLNLERALEKVCKYIDILEITHTSQEEPDYWLDLAREEIKKEEVDGIR
jgi:hypothetical protein